MKSRSIPLRIDESLAERITRTAKRLNLPRSVLVRAAIELQLDRIERGALNPGKAPRTAPAKKT